jgi:hypothetical protein
MKLILCLILLVSLDLHADPISESTADAGRATSVGALATAMFQYMTVRSHRVEKFIADFTAIKVAAENSRIAQIIEILNTKPIQQEKEIIRALRKQYGDNHKLADQAKSPSKSLRQVRRLRNISAITTLAAGALLGFGMASDAGAFENTNPSVELIDDLPLEGAQ